MDAHVAVAVSGALRFAERVDKRRAFQVVATTCDLQRELRGERNGGESGLHSRPRIVATPGIRTALYCTVTDPFMFSARWGMQWNGYVPLGTFAKEMVSLSPAFMRKLLCSGAI